MVLVKTIIKEVTMKNILVYVVGLLLILVLSFALYNSQPYERSVACANGAWSSNSQEECPTPEYINPNPPQFP
jgi:hypothetical protein